MKRLLALFFSLVAQLSLAQCVSLSELRALAQQSPRERRDFLTARGFAHLDSAQSGNPYWQWRQPTSRAQIDVYGDVNDKTGQRVFVSTLLPAADGCSQRLATELAALGLQQNTEFTAGRMLVRYYAGPDCYLRLVRYAYQGKTYQSYQFFPSKGTYLLSLRHRA